MADSALLDDLPPIERLALAYAPLATRRPWLSFFSLDARCARFVTTASEPITAQLRLAWWRDRLGESAEQWPTGEPLLEALGSWRGQHDALLGIVDGWEMMTAEIPRSREAFEELAAGKARAIASLQKMGAAREDGVVLQEMAMDWALCDLAGKLHDNDERRTLDEMIAARCFESVRVPRSLRPLAVLHALSRQSRRSALPLQRLPARAMARAVIAGFSGR